MDEEIWRAIKGFEGLYEVSNLGRVKSLERVSSLGRRVNEKILSPGKDKDGYLFVILYRDGKHITYKSHRLVLSTFNPVENMENLEVNHMDEDKENNNLTNLEWCTRKENCNHGTRNARVSEKLTNGKLSIPISQLSLDGKYIRSWKSASDAEREEGFNHGNIIQCCKNKFHREGNNIYKGYKWQYLHVYMHNIDPRIRKVILFGKEYEF